MPPFKPFPISGIAKLADENVPGSTVRVRNAVMVQPGIMKRRVPYTTMRAPLPPNVQYYGLAANNFRAICAAWVGQPLFNGKLLVGDRLSWLAMPVQAGDRVGSSFLRGYDDVLNAVDLYGGGGVLFGTSPPVVVGNSLGAGARLGGSPRGQDISLSATLGVGAVAVNAASPSIGFASGDAVAYRCVIGYERLNASGTPVEVMGAPGGRFLFLVPTSSAGGVPRLRVRIPGTIGNYITWSTGTSLNAYVWVYRSTLLTGEAAKALSGVSSVAPSDEMQLVFKTKLLAADFSAGYFEFTDVCPVGAEGPPLYTNPTLGGIAVERGRPPACNSVATFKDTTFYGGTLEKVGRTTIILVGPPHVFASSITSTGSAFTLVCIGTVAPVLTAGMIFSVIGTGISADYVVSGTATLSAGILTVPVTGAPAAATYLSCYATFARITVTSSIGSIASAFSMTYDASLNSSPTGAVGKWYISLPLRGYGGFLDVQMKAYVQAIAASLATCINITGIPGGGTVNRPYEICASNNATGTLDAASIMVEIRGDAASGIYCSFAAVGSTYNLYDLASKIPPITDAQPSSQSNFIQWGPPGIVDAVCPKYSLAIGSPTKEILKLVATKNALYIFKEDGLWILDGDGSGGTSWGLTHVSSDVVALTPSSIDVYEDTVFVATTYGVLMISGATIVNISHNILSEYSDAIASRKLTNGSGGLAYGGYSVTCSHKEQSVSVNIPTVGIYPSFTPTSISFIYSFTTQEWVIDSSSAMTIFAGDSNVGIQVASPARSRLSVRVQQLAFNDPTTGFYNVFDIIEKRVVRFPDPIAPYATSLAIESAASDAYNEPAYSLSEVGTRLPLEEESCYATATTAAGITTLTFPSGCPVSPENLAIGSVVLATGGVGAWVTYLPTSMQWVSFTTGAPFFIGSLGLQLTLPGAPNISGQVTLFTIMPTEVQFSPIGDGICSYNFNQVGIFQTRRGSVKNMNFSFWVDATSSFPYVAPDVETVGPQLLRTKPSAVIRAAVPDRMTRGSRLNVKIATIPVFSERFEISKLLSSHTPTSAEETEY